MSDGKFTCEYAARGQAGCKKCKQKIEKGCFRIGKLVPNPFSDSGGEMKQWYHARCLFETFERARATTKKIEDTDDLEGYCDLKDEEKKLVRELIENFLSKQGSPKKNTAKVQTKLKVDKSPQKDSVAAGTSSQSSTKGSVSAITLAKDDDDPSATEKDNAFRTYRKLCAEIAEESSYTGKTKILADFIKFGTSGGGFKGDVYLLVKLLLPGVVKRIYNVKDKQLIKLFSTLFGTSRDKMVEHLEQGDAAETVRIYFEQSRLMKPSKKSTLSNQEVDEFLDTLSNLSKEEDQQRELGKISAQCTSNDLKMIVRLIKHDLRINCGAKHILDALDPNAYAAFQASRNLHDVVSRVAESHHASGGRPEMKKSVSVRASLMTPVLPMLAEACRSVEQAMRRCPKGMYAEIKYDGERLQLHKQGSKFQYFSRSLKPVLPHKVVHFKEFIPQAFPAGNDLIIDAEVLLVDTKTGNPLPFGTLGVHKKEKFKDAVVCLFVFDILHLNGDNLMDRPIKERRRILEKHMTEVKNHIMFSEQKFINKPAQLEEMLKMVFSEGLEGLVMKEINSIYEPGKRHWLKVKKDYLSDGAMADSADLIVLGAYYGTGNKGGMMSVFLMGCYDPKSGKFCTVTKCGNGHDDKTLERLQTELDMVKISKDYNKVPNWLNIKRTLVPDFICKDPKEAPIWEITGAEFSKSQSHTADGISIRFPRVTKIRDDKTWKEATDLARMHVLLAASRAPSDIVPPKGVGGKRKRDEEDDDDEEEEEEEEDEPRPKKARQSNKNAGVVAKSVPMGSSCLRSIFTGMVFHIDESLPQGPDRNKLKRFLIAHDADVVDDTQIAMATHSVVKATLSPSKMKKKPDDPDLTTVTMGWVWQCIKRKKLLPIP